MKRAGLGWFSAVRRSAGVPRDVTRADSAGLVGVRRRFLLELQWRGRGGKFRHLAVGRPGLRQAAGALGIVALLTLAVGVAGTFSLKSNRPRPHFGAGAILREHTDLKARHDALRERAFDLAEQLYARVEQGRRMVRMAGTTNEALEDWCPRPPARDVGDEAIFVWLSQQGARLEAIGDELTAGRVEPGMKRASVPAPVITETAPTRNTGVVEVADSGSARRLVAAPAKR